MAKRYITSLLSEKLGAYLDGLDSTDIQYSLSEAILQMSNVTVREDALTKLKLPIQIKHGMIRKLDVRVPWRTISSSPVQITFEGIDLLLTPQEASSWEFQDVYTPEYLTQQLQAMIQDAIVEHSTEAQQSYLDSFKFKILDNIKVKISDVHIRVEHFISATKLGQKDAKQSSFGILLRSFDICTTDKDGNEVFHDRFQSKTSIYKKVSLEGLAVYLNPKDDNMIHKLPMKMLSKNSEVSDRMRNSIQRYIELTDVKENDEVRILDDPSLTYILRPLSLRILVQRRTEKPEKLSVEITLDQFSLQFLYQQLKAILVFAKLAQQYKRKANEQEKVKKYRFLRQPNMNAEQKWVFAIECIRRSIRIKNGALTAFNIPKSRLDELQANFRPLLLQYHQTPEAQRQHLVSKVWSLDEQRSFWHTLGCIPPVTITAWIKDIVVPLNIKKEEEKPTQGGGWLSWIYGSGSAQKTENEEDNLDEFFDCQDEEGQDQKEKKLGTRERTSLEVVFEVKELTLLLAKLKTAQNKLDGIQMYNKGAIIELKSPNLKLDQFVCDVTFQESGVNLVTIDRSTGNYQDCTAAIQQNKQLVALDQQSRPQLTMEIKKGDSELLKNGIEYDINLQIGSVIYKHYEDLIIRAKAISNVKIDMEIQSAAMDTLEDLRETTQNRLYELMHKNKNRYVISVESPVLIIPIHATFEGKNAPVWVIRTGNLLVVSEDLEKQTTKVKKYAEVLSNINTTKTHLQEDVYDGYKINLTQIGLHYYQSYSIYQKAQSQVKIGQFGVYAGKDLPEMPARFHDFTNKQKDHLDEKRSTQTMKEFSVLEDFEIRVLLKTLVKQKDKLTVAPKVEVEINTTPININFSHSIYNQMMNFAHIFKISKEKQKQFQDEEESYNTQVKTEVQQEMVCEGLVRRLLPDSVMWEENFAILSGRYLYFYKDREATAYLDFVDIQGAEILSSAQTVTLTQQNVKWSFIPKDAQINWLHVLRQQIFNLRMKDFNETPDSIEKVLNKKRIDIRRKAQNPEQVKMRVDFQVSSMKLNLLRMILMPGTKAIQLPPAFEDWVTLEFQNMSFQDVSREYDSELIVKFQQITMSDCTMPLCNQTLISQTVQGSTEGGPTTPSLEIVLSKQKEDSSKYKGLLYDVEVNLVNVNFKFMPGSINQVIKLLRSTKLQTKPQHFEGDEHDYEQQQFLEASDSFDEQQQALLLPTRLTDTDPRMTIGMTPESQQLLNSTESGTSLVQKFFDTTCSQNKVQTNRYRIKISNIKMVMLHHKYTMELYSLDASSLNIEMSEWYDHSSFATSMTNLRLCDLSNHPYTRSPKAYFETVSQGLEPGKITPNEMIRCNDFEFCLQSFQSPKCALKHPDHNNKLVMRISPFRINYVQEVTMRFVEYFQQRFIDSLTMSDPYKNPKEEFEARQKRQGIPIDKINHKTDFKQLLQVDFMDIQISKAEIFARDRPFSKNYILISSPLIKVSSQLVKVLGRFPLKPDIALGMQRYKVELQTINFWYGISKKRKDRLSLLKKTFNVMVDYDALQYSELLEKIDHRQMDKSTNVKIDFDPMMLVLPQAVYTYILRCSDLNFAWTDRLQAEFYCVKWIHMTEYYKNFKKVVSQRQNINIPLLSLTLKHTDGSFISELLLRAFSFGMTRFMDGASEQLIFCSKFFILDQQDQKKAKVKQAIVCPWSSPLEIDPALQMNKLTEEEMAQEAQLKVSLKMKPTGDKKITINITGLKIFVKLPLFILLQGFFMNAFPKYMQDDIDKPVGFVGNDPDNTSRMIMNLKIHKSLICLLNQPGYKSIAMQGEIEFETMQENITRIKKAYNSLGGVRHESRDRTMSFVTDQEPNSDNVYTMKLSVAQLTPYICSLSHLESGEVDFTQINKRQIFSPLDMSYVCNYQLTPETDEDLQETGNWGVVTKTSIKIGQLQFKLSILDLHLILQVTAFASEQMAKETVYRLQEIERSIDQEFLTKMKSDELTGDTQPAEAENNNFDNLDQSSKTQQDQKNEFFDKLIKKFQESNTNSMATVMERLSQTTRQFKKLTQGYTGQSYNERESFLQFITKDILERDEGEIEIEQFQVVRKPQTQVLIQQPSAQRVVNKIEETSSEDEDQAEESDPDSDKFFDVTEEKSQYMSLIKSERQKSLHIGFKSIVSAAASNPNTSKAISPQPASALASSLQTHKLSTQSRKNPNSQYSSSWVKSNQGKSNKRSKSYNSDGEGDEGEGDEFHSARGSFESIQNYRGQVENALDVFYSFKGERPEALKEDNPTFGGAQSQDEEDDVRPVEIVGIESIRETMADMRRSDTLLKSFSIIESSEESTEIAPPRITQHLLSDATEQKSTMQNVLEDIKDMYCEQISILAINDYNCGFTPVLQLEFAKILMNQSWKKSNQTEMGLVLPEILLNYYNIELGEWEPLLEPTQMILDQQTTPTDSKTTITIKEPVNFNSTEECLKNLFYTYESWMQTPQFFQKPVKEKKAKKQKKGRFTSRRREGTINESKEGGSDVEDDYYGKVNKNNKMFLYQMRESVVNPRSELLLTKNESSNQLLFTSQLSEEPLNDDLASEIGAKNKFNNQQLVTPFSIANYTSRTIKIVRGGIKPGYFHQVKNYQARGAEVSGQAENQSVYVVQPGLQTDYAVTYDRLMGIQKIDKKERDDSIEISIHSQSQSEQDQDETASVVGEVAEQVLQKKLQKLKNNEIIGIQLSELDYVPYVDLNRNTGQNPWVHEISPSRPKQDQKGFKPNPIDNETPLLEGYDQPNEPQPAEQPATNSIKNKVFYGTLLKGMRKFLIVRAPYCILNKTSYQYEVRILASNSKEIKLVHKILQGESLGLDDFYCQGHQLQVKLVRKEDQYEPSNDLGWSDSVQITALFKLPLNEGTGIYVTSAEKLSVTTCLKRQSGEINGTVDFVLLPAVTIKNCLPCSMLVRQRNSVGKVMHSSVALVEQGHTIDQHQINQSQEKQFHLFHPIRGCKDKDQDEFQIEIGVDGFLFVPLDLKNSAHIVTDEVDLELADQDGHTLKIGLRKAYANSGFHLIVFAHVVILLETILVLPLMKIYYKEGRFSRERRELANADQMTQRKYIMCNKESDIVVGMKQNKLDLLPNSYSPGLDLQEAGNQTSFSVMAALQPNQPQNSTTRYDFVCTPSIQLANNESRIFTKVVQIAPAYVICNQTKTNIEIAQADHINARDKQDRIFKAYEKREWYWPVGNLAENALKIIIRKIQPVEIMGAKMMQSKTLQAQDSQDFEQPDGGEQRQRRFSESDRVHDWQWSKPISLNIKDQISFPVLLCEQHGSRKKILLIGKKVIGSTTFITIKEEKQSAQPTYLIKNNCPNLRLSFHQDGQAVVSTWKLNELAQTSYAHLDPQANVKSASFNMTIDKSVRRWNFKQHHCFERQVANISFDTEVREEIRYPDIDNKDRCIKISLSNDGLTKTLTFELVGESRKKEKKKLQHPTLGKKKEQISLLKRSTINVVLQSISLSVVGYTDTTVQQQSLKKEYQTRRERNEIALVTISGLNFSNTTNLDNNSQQTNLEIVKFQVDNQSSQNPLFHTILQKRDTSIDAAPFLLFIFKRQFNQETNINTFEFFELQLAEYVLRLDDNFMMNMSNTMLKALSLNETNQQQEHPLFMKDNFYEPSGFLDVYIQSESQFTSEVQMDAGLRTSEQRNTFAMQLINNRKRAVIKQQPVGVVTVSEIRFNNKIEEVPVRFRHWMMQDKSLEDSAKLELRHFKISKIVLDLTFIFRTKDKKLAVQGPMGYLQKSGLKLASIDELLLKFDEFNPTRDRFIAQTDFQNQLNKFYFQKARSQVIKSLLTIKAIGSLPNLFRHVGEGCYDLVAIPRAGFNRSWYRGVGGVFIGCGRFLKHSFIGLFGTTQVIGESWSELALAMGLDKDYAIKHEEEVITERPKNFVEGLGYGARSALQSIPDACIGLFTRPFVEANRSGLQGLGLGLYEGITGLLWKPLSGTLDLIAKTSEGCKNTLRIFEQKQKKGRVRMPRTFYGMQRRIKAFSEDDAFIVSNVLCQIKRGEFALDHYIDMKLIRTASDNRAPHFLLLSEENLFLIEASQKALVWHIEQKHIIKIQNMSNGLLINLKESEDYAGRAQVGLPLDGQSSVEINEWFGQIMSDQF